MGTKLEKLLDPVACKKAVRQPGSWALRAEKTKTKQKTNGAAQAVHDSAEEALEEVRRDDSTCT